MSVFLVNRYINRKLQLLTLHKSYFYVILIVPQGMEGFMNMKKFFCVLSFFLFAFVIMSCDKDKEGNEDSGEENKVAFHIGIVTGTVSQAEDEQRGAEAMIAKYGDADKGGMVRHLNYPDNYMQEQETTIQQIAS